MFKKTKVFFVSLLSSLGHILLKKNIRNLTITSVSLIIIQTLLVTFSLHRLPPQVPLFYSRPWGEEQLATDSSLFLLPISCFTVLVVNLILSLFFIEKRTFLTELLNINTIFFIIFSLIILVKIILITT